VNEYSLEHHGEQHESNQQKRKPTDSVRDFGSPGNSQKTTRRKKYERAEYIFVAFQFHRFDTANANESS